MELYLMRHGVAEERAATGRDADRPLTPAGVQIAQRVLSRADAAGISPALIISSPYRRALETAAIAAKQFGRPDAVTQSTRLTPDSSVEDLWGEVRAYRAEGSLLLVFHEPLISAVVADLLGSARLNVHLPPAVLLRFDVPTAAPSPSGALKWMLTGEIC